MQLKFLNVFFIVMPFISFYEFPKYYNIVFYFPFFSNTLLFLIIIFHSFLKLLIATLLSGKMINILQKKLGMEIEWFIFFELFCTKSGINILTQMWQLVLRIYLYHFYFHYIHSRWKFSGWMIIKLHATVIFYFIRNY